MKTSYIKNKYCEIWIEKDIIHAIYNPSIIVIDIKVAMETVNTRLKVSNEITRPVLIDTCNAKSMNKEARDYLAQGDAMKFLSATAIIIYNKVARVGANFYISLSRPTIPTKVFTHKTKALKWLAQFKIQ